MGMRLLYTIFFLFASIQAYAQIYTYDANNKLTKVEYGNGVTVSYEYDVLGNRTSRKVTGSIAETYTIKVSAVPSNYGTVSGGGIFGIGTNVEINASPYAGFEFQEWNDGSTDNPRTLTVTKDQSFTAHFKMSETNNNYDANGDGVINSYDLDAIIDAYLEGAPATPATDLDGDGAVTIADASILIAQLNDTHTGTYNGHDYVDLGLPSGTLWATCNVGASYPEENGCFYAWGEVTGSCDGKDRYSWSTYKYDNGMLGDELTKYNFDPDIGYNGFTDNLGTLDPTDDAATVNWGGNWRMPTRRELSELYNKKYTQWTFTTLNGVKGFIITSIVKGYTGNSIFLPAEGGLYHGKSNDLEGKLSYYWTSTLTSNYQYCAECYDVRAYDGKHGTNYRDRCEGMFIRPVLSADGIPAELVPTLSEDELIVMERKYLVKSDANVFDYAYQGFSFIFDNDRRLEINYLNAYYWDSWNDSRVGVYVIAYEGENTRLKEWYIEPRQEDTWTNERIEIDKNGKVRYYSNGDFKGEESFEELNLETANKVFLVHAPGGWWYNHYHYMDDFSITTPATVIKDDFNDGILDMNIWKQPANPDGVREEDGILKAEQLRTDIDFNLYSNSIPLIKHGTLYITMNSVDLKIGNSATVEIISGNGIYEISNSSTNVVEATLSGTTIKLTGISVGTSIVTVKDRSSGQTASINVTVSSSSGDCPVAEAIDLGLPSGTLWASWNIGASAPEGYGNYYAWGETETKDYYDWSTYTHCDGPWQSAHFIGGDIAGTEYDVAYEKWGGSWRMPSYNQIKELLDNCTQTWTQQNGIRGILVTGRNGNSIFLPAAGYHLHMNLYSDSSHGYYWSSTVNPDNVPNAYGIDFSSGGTNLGYYSRDRGRSVRAVKTPEKPQECPVAEAIDLGLPSGTKWASWNIGASKPEEYGGYYAWGETEEKDYYDWSTYIHCDGSEETCHHIGDDIAGTEYDVAHVKWGGSWRMPTRAQQDELRENCTREWTQQNGVNGIRVIGPNGNSIFLPAAGYRWDDYLNCEGSNGYYWSSSLGYYYSYDACSLLFGSDYWYWSDYFIRHPGRSVRAVCP
jgi:YD repeat-containing protein